MIKYFKDIQSTGYSDDDKPWQYCWGTLFGHLSRINGNCNILNKKIKIKVIDKYNNIHFTNSKIYLTDNNKKADEREISFVIRVEDNCNE